MGNGGGNSLIAEAQPPPRNTEQVNQALRKVSPAITHEIVTAKFRNTLNTVSPL